MSNPVLQQWRGSGRGGAEDDSGGEDGREGRQGQGVVCRRR